MKTLKITAGLAIVACSALTYTPNAMASHSTTTCTNSCVIEDNGNGVVTIRDCCGGQVSTQYPPHTVPEAPDAP